ncbi:hypothetical protein HZU77_012055 [Neisseriaceae bacterium TC5R-5]|nr:hypothetical protein [Neisseriaceae bacterium TC5R-5]
METEVLLSNSDQALSILTLEEVESISGGVIEGGCIVQRPIPWRPLPILIGINPPIRQFL